MVDLETTRFSVCPTVRFQNVPLRSENKRHRGKKESGVAPDDGSWDLPERRRAVSPRPRERS